MHNPTLDEKFKERVERVSRETLQLLTWSQIRLSTAARFLITNIIPMVGLVVVYGPPKCGKTFWVFDLVMHIALGWSYRGLRTKQGLIVYCLFEGQANFAARVEAFRQRHLAENGEDVPFLLMCAKLELVKEHPRLIRDIKRQTDGTKLAAIVMDTLNRSITGSESSDVDMSNYVKACDAIREAFECAVIVVHHSGLEGGRARGHTSLLGAADAQIGVKQDDGKNVIATVEYMKDGPAGQEIVSRLEVVEIDIDEDGEPITSCTVEPSEPQPKQPARGKREAASILTFHRAFDEAIHTHGKPHHVLQSTGIHSPVVNAVPVEAVRSEFYRRYAARDSEPDKALAARRQAFNRSLNTLIGQYGREVLPSGEEILWRTLRSP